MRRLLIPTVVFMALVAGLAISKRDTVPPKVYIEAPEKVPAGLPFDLKMSADEPVTYTIKYGDLELTETVQNYTVSLLAYSGAVPIEVTATDTSKNQNSYQLVVYGIPSLKPSLQLKPSAIPGEAVAITVGWDSQGLQPKTVIVNIAGQPNPVFISAGKVVSLWAVPLGQAVGPIPVSVSLTDEHNRTVKLEASLIILEDPRPVEELNLSADTLQVVTPEGRELEQQALEAAYAAGAEHPFPQWTEPFMQPAQGRFTSPFGLPRRYVAGGNISYHFGTDIAAPTGTPIYATNVGRIVVADFYPIKGGLVVIDHGASVYSLYFHQSKILVNVGDTVSRGQQVGEIGTTGLSTGPHLHWEMRVNQVATDPMLWVGRVLPE
jgi:murein DD-endopeptidase MepM/ murein hydrolase activator NlpD